MAEHKLKKLPLGLADFREIRQGNYVYVDKTQLIYQLVTGDKYYFLSRPRRFGKSLLVSTLDELFSGNKKLFENLWISQSDYSWPQYPVIKIDFSGMDYSSGDRLEKSLLQCLQSIAKHYDIKLAQTESAKDFFSALIDELATKNKIVLLIDEYDKPIIDNIYDAKKAGEQRTILQNFYATIKAKDAKLRFALFTGVTKFARASIFSGLNNLRDITLSEQFSTLLGYTADEIKVYFDDHIHALAKKLDISVQSAYEQFAEYYDSYCFSIDERRMYNPFSVLNSLTDQRFGYYWFATGTPAFLLHVIRNQAHDLSEIEEPILDEIHLDKVDIERVPLTALLFQTGYLTIKKFDQKTHKFTLNFPNKEVRNAFISNLADIFIDLAPEQTIEYAHDIAYALKDNNLKSVQNLLQDLFNKMPYTTHIKNERDVHFVLYCIFKLIGIEVDSEVATSIGRADLVISLPKLVYIIELKFNKTAQEALAQIQDKKYYEKYVNSSKQIFLLGINFDEPIKSISLESQEIYNLSV